MLSSTEIRTRGNSDRNLSSNSEQFYENYWQDAPKISETTRQRNKAILDQFMPLRPTGLKILEIGVGGEGGLIYSLKEKNQVFGIDVSPSAKRNSERLGITVDIVNVDKCGIPFEDTLFDVVIAFEVFEHFANPQFALEEIRRVLKKNGLMLVSIPNPLIHHWPRLFYPTLFEEKAFREFLLINEFKIKSKINLGLNMYHHLLSDTSTKVFMWCWECNKIDEADELFENGLFFWEETNEWNIRTRPIEAMDLFRRSLEKGGENNIKARLFLTLALRYRYVYQETEEFLKQIEWFMDQALNNQSPFNIQSLFALTVIQREMQQWGLSFFDSETADGIYRGLEQIPGSKPYLDILSKIESGNLDCRTMAACLL